MKSDELPIVCDLTVFPSSTRAEMAAMVRDLFQSVQTVQELPDGYAFRFPNQPGMFLKMANFVEYERQCCAFYSFVLEAEPNGGPFWLHMTGGEGVKEFLHTVWADVQGAVASELMRIGENNDLDEAIAQVTPVLQTVMEKAEPLASKSPTEN